MTIYLLLDIGNQDTSPLKPFIDDRRWRDRGFVIYSTKFTHDKRVNVTLMKPYSEAEAADVESIEANYNVLNKRIMNA